MKHQIFDATLSALNAGEITITEATKGEKELLDNSSMMELFSDLALDYIEKTKNRQEASEVMGKVMRRAIWVGWKAHEGYVAAAELENLIKMNDEPVMDKELRDIAWG